MRESHTCLGLLGLALGVASACSPGSEQGIATLDVSSIDAEVFAVAVEDFASSTDHCTPAVSEYRVLVDSTTLQAGAMTSDAQVRAEIGDEDRASLVPLLGDLRERNSVGQPLSWQPPASLGVVVTDLSLLESEYDFVEGYPGARCHLRLWLPGHSDDRKLSLIRFSWGPTRHGASATYLLERTERGWRVRWRYIAIHV